MRKENTSICGTSRNGSLLKRSFIVSNINFIDPEEGKPLLGTVFFSLCSSQAKPEKCNAEGSKTYGYFSDNDKTCLALSQEDESKRPLTVWTSDFNYEVR